MGAGGWGLGVGVCSLQFAVWVLTSVANSHNFPVSQAQHARKMMSVVVRDLT